MMSLALLCFPCCVDNQPPPRRRPKIDRSQIGLPTNFQHTGHIGSGEVAAGFDVQQVQSSMQSKGGYDNQPLNGVSATTDDAEHVPLTSPEQVHVSVSQQEDETTINTTTTTTTSS